MLNDEIHKRWLDGQSIHDISKQTGLGKWAIYKRLQRLQKLQEPQQVQKPDNLSEMPPIPEQEPKTDWTKAFAVFGAIITIVLGVLAYRKLQAPKYEYIENTY